MLKVLFSTTVLSNFAKKAYFYYLMGVKTLPSKTLKRQPPKYRMNPHRHFNELLEKTSRLFLHLIWHTGRSPNSAPHKKQCTEKMEGFSILRGKYLGPTKWKISAMGGKFLVGMQSQKPFCHEQYRGNHSLELWQPFMFKIWYTNDFKIEIFF